MRVSFENSTVCRTVPLFWGASFWIGFNASLFSVALSGVAGFVWLGFQPLFLLESLILAQDERWRRA